MLMSVTAVSSPHVAPQTTTALAATRTQPAASNKEAARPAQSPPAAPGTGLKVDKHA
jgi:hypothetical protein